MSFISVRVQGVSTLTIRGLLVNYLFIKNAKLLALISYLRGGSQFNHMGKFFFLMEKLCTMYQKKKKKRAGQKGRST